LAAAVRPHRWPRLTFGEAAVNLTAAGVFPSGTCEAFGSAFLKSRSSASFPAEVKDFVAPQPVNISNCGTIVIKKVTIPSPDPTNTSFAFTLTGGPSNLNKSFSLLNGGSETTNKPARRLRVRGRGDGTRELGTGQRHLR
jgi:hypothetical protein